MNKGIRWWFFPSNTFSSGKAFWFFIWEFRLIMTSYPPLGRWNVTILTHERRNCQFSSWRIPMGTMAGWQCLGNGEFRRWKHHGMDLFLGSSFSFDVLSGWFGLLVFGSWHKEVWDDQWSPFSSEKRAGVAFHSLQINLYFRLSWKWRAKWNLIFITPTWRGLEMTPVSLVDGQSPVQVSSQAITSRSISPLPILTVPQSLSWLRFVG